MYEFNTYYKKLDYYMCMCHSMVAFGSKVVRLILIAAYIQCFFLGGIAHPIEWLCWSVVSESVSQSVSQPLFTLFPLEYLDETWSGNVSWVYLVTP